MLDAVAGSAERLKEKTMIKKYRIQTRWLKAEIEVVDVVRETAQYVFLRGVRGWDKSGERKVLKFSEDYEYHNTWDEAHAALMERAELRLRRARIELPAAKWLHGDIKGMRPEK